jgi:cellulose synthase/poly-beta-1,6-N-acetylglucosamine synthase-like glycosyltransferase
MFALLVYNSVEIFKDVINWNMLGDFVIPVLYLKILIIFVIAGHALPVLWTFSVSKWCEMIISLPSYIFYVPSYINTLLVYSFCRIDDLSWGTKGLDDDIERAKSLEWKR